MKRRGSCKPLAALGVTCAALATFAAPAMATDEKKFTFLGAGDSHVQYLAVNLMHDGSVAAGRYGGEFGTGPKFYIFCTDFTHWIDWNQSYSTLAVEGAVTAAGQSLNPIAQSTTDYFYQSKPAATPAGAQGTAGGLISALTLQANSGPSTPSDYFRNRQVGNDAHSYVTGPGTGPLTLVQRTQAVAYLTNQYLNSALDTVHIAGVQLAIWDIVQDGGDGFGSGYVQKGSGNGTDANRAFSDALTYETEAGNHLANSSKAIWIQSIRSAANPSDGHAQDFTYSNPNITGGPVPEPAFYQMSALLLLGGAGMLKLRRSRK